MTGQYEREYHSLDSVAVKTEQQEVHAPEHITYNDEQGRARLVKCPNCEAHYTLGYPKQYRPDSFENLAEVLVRILLRDHGNHHSHDLVIPLPPFRT